MPRYIAILFALPLLWSLCFPKEEPKKDLDSDMLSGLMGGTVKSTRTCKEKSDKDKLPAASSKILESITGVEFYIGGMFRGHSKFDVQKTTKGVLATYMKRATIGPVYEYSEAMLNAEEWLRFVNSVYKSVDKWEKKCTTESMDGTQWSLDIIFSGKKDTLKFYGSNAYPSNWDKFTEIIEQMKARMTSKIDSSQYSKNSRSTQEIMRVVNAYFPRFRNAYNKYHKQKTDFIRGRIILKFAITPSGEATDIDILASTTNDPEFDNTIKNTLATFKWKAIESGNSTVIIPLDFKE